MNSNGQQAVFRTHGMSTTPEYHAWSNMGQRCTNPNHPQYVDYGGRGINICSRWLSSFETFYSDMGPRPSAQHTIERRDVNGNYEPGNCYWATWDVQQNNKRSNVRYELDGQALTIPQLTAKTGVGRGAVLYRLKQGKTIAEAITKGRERNTRYDHAGQSLTLKEWAAESGLRYGTLHQRVAVMGLSIGDALKKPSRSKSPVQPNPSTGDVKR